ncbi:16S rRNA (guanine(527)-N(7))-methyltransferase RsmG [Ramlibacter sp.]|uniref:16S rRNA (guanine(527)-N(7))-methyltransferase RsmG n=1 Tax=Ramlibacter sp. TaxID=1917967 RepID=UPI002D466F20|nr:16S rRNA (guanine(527)-N(7))-methyltransferase RsmG [Ramlibacter sp.]HYD76188.1 16S rRNA (guanine(527)-N(7))-methyltransferase RsmG [Ramlibacter sp.]
MSLRADLDAGLAALGLQLQPEQVERLLGYLDLLGKWSKVYNLTAVREPGEMLTHHLLDSLAVVAPLRRQAGEAGRLLDVGSGAGLPGAVLAICCPGWQVDCLDAVGKKAAFVQQVAGALGLPNLRGIHARVEAVQDRYDVVSSRAFASLADFVGGSRQALAGQGIWMAMKGKHPQAEIDALPAGVDVFHVEQLAVPGLDAERCIVWMRPVGTRG